MNLSGCRLISLMQHDVIVRPFLSNLGDGRIGLVGAKIGSIPQCFRCVSLPYFLSFVLLAVSHCFFCLHELSHIRKVEKFSITISKWPTFTHSCTNIVCMHSVRAGPALYKSIHVHAWTFCGWLFGTWCIFGQAPLLVSLGVLDKTFCFGYGGCSHFSRWRM